MNKKKKLIINFSVLFTLAGTLVVALVDLNLVIYILGILGLALLAVVLFILKIFSGSDD